MAAKGHAGSRDFSWKLCSALCHALSEGFLIIMLIVIAIMSYSATRFARICRLRSPCMLCSRLDWVLHGKPWFSNELVCAPHRLEIACLSYCQNHNKLALSDDLCEKCLLLCSGSVDKLGIMTNISIKKPSNSRSRSRDKRQCSCCLEPFKKRRNMHMLSEHTGGNFPDDGIGKVKGRSISMSSVGHSSNDGLGQLPRRGYIKQKTHRDSESEIHVSDDDDGDGDAMPHEARQRTRDTSFPDSELKPMTTKTRTLSTSPESPISAKLMNTTTSFPLNNPTYISKAPPTPLNTPTDTNNAAKSSDPTILHAFNEITWSQDYATGNNLEASLKVVPDQLCHDLPKHKSFLVGIEEVNHSEGVSGSLDEEATKEFAASTYAVVSSIESAHISTNNSFKSTSSDRDNLQSSRWCSARGLDGPLSEASNSPRDGIQIDENKQADTTGNSARGLDDSSSEVSSSPRNNIQIDEYKQTDTTDSSARGRDGPWRELSTSPRLDIEIDEYKKTDATGSSQFLDQDPSDSGMSEDGGQVSVQCLKQQNELTKKKLSTEEVIDSECVLGSPDEEATKHFAAVTSSIANAHISGNNNIKSTSSDRDNLQSPNWSSIQGLDGPSSEVSTSPGNSIQIDEYKQIDATSSSARGLDDPWSEMSTSPRNDIHIDKYKHNSTVDRRQFLDLEPSDVYAASEDEIEVSLECMKQQADLNKKSSSIKEIRHSENVIGSPNVGATKSFSASTYEVTSSTASAHISDNNGIKSTSSSRSNLQSPRWTEIMSTKDTHARMQEEVNTLSSTQGPDGPWSEVSTSPRTSIHIDEYTQTESIGSRQFFDLEPSDAHATSEDEDEVSLEGLKQQAELKKKLSILYKELEAERSASAVAASEAMAMINRLHEEKAAMHLDALQYLRIMEDQADHDQEAIDVLNDLLTDKEKEILDLEAELREYQSKFGEEQSDAGSVAFSFLDSSDLARNAFLDFESEKAKIMESLSKLEETLGMSFTNRLDLGGTNNDLQVGQLKNHPSSGGSGQYIENPELECGTSALPCGHLNGESVSSPRNCEIQSVENQNKSGPHSCLDDEKISSVTSIKHEISLLRSRSEAIEADLKFLKQVLSSLRCSNDGMQYMQEIIKHLQELRRIMTQQRDSSV